MSRKNVLILYATMHGHAELVARKVSTAAAEWNADANVQDVRTARADDLAQRDAILLVASVHYGRHPRSMVRFVRKNLARFATMDSAFISVSGDAVDPSTRPRAEDYVRKFVQATGWRPAASLVVGGAVKFTKYNWLLRYTTRRSFAAKGIMLDPRRDYDYTDWNAVLRFAKEFLTNRDVRVA